MYRTDNGLDNTEYYLETDNVNNTVSVMKYVFNVFSPNGAEHNICSIHCNKKSGYTLDEAEDLMRGLVDMLNTTRWGDENNVY